MNDKDILAGLNLRTIIEIIPVALFIIDDETRIMDFNSSASKLIGKNADNVLYRLCGEALHCFHAKNAPDGCGTTKSCSDCVIRNTVKEACLGNTVVKKRADLLIQKQNDTYKAVFSVSASPFKNNGKTLSVFCMEDITEIVVLRDLIPMCSHCKSIRKDDECWEPIEKFLDQQSGAQLSHGICPDCAKKYYPDLDLYND